MPALDINFKDLDEKGFIKVLSGNDYLTVQGRLYLAHSSGQLIGVDTEELYPDDPDFITVKATVTIFNPAILALVERIATDKELHSGYDVSPLMLTLIHNALISQYTGMAQSKRKGGRSAEGTNPREVAETSAVGRALGNAGFGDTESFASFEEMMVAISRGNSEPETKAPAKKTTKKVADPNKPTTEKKQELYDMAEERLGVTTVEAFTEAIEKREEAQGKKLADFTSADIDRLIAALQALPPF